MLEHHLTEVQDLLLAKKAEYEEFNDMSSSDQQQVHAAGPLRSPPLPLAGALGRAFTPTAGAKGPQMGFFSVPGKSPGPRSPRIAWVDFSTIFVSATFDFSSFSFSTQVVRVGDVAEDWVFVSSVVASEKRALFSLTNFVLKKGLSYFTDASLVK
jgi:hypothetical protein